MSRNKIDGFTSIVFKHIRACVRVCACQLCLRLAVVSVVHIWWWNWCQLILFATTNNTIEDCWTPFKPQKKAGKYLFCHLLSRIYEQCLLSMVISLDFFHIFFPVVPFDYLCQHSHIHILAFMYTCSRALWLGIVNKIACISCEIKIQFQFLYAGPYYVYICT